MNPYAILAVLILTLGAGVQGYRMGGAANQARYDAALAANLKASIAAGELAAAVETERLRAENKARLLSQALEDAAYADPPAAAACLSRDRVLRLKAR